MNSLAHRVHLKFTLQLALGNTDWVLRLIQLPQLPWGGLPSSCFHCPQLSPTESSLHSSAGHRGPLQSPLSDLFNLFPACSFPHTFCTQIQKAACTSPAMHHAALPKPMCLCPCSCPAWDAPCPSLPTLTSRAAQPYPSRPAQMASM